MRQSRWPRVPMAEHREPCESRGSRTVLGAPGGEIPPGDSTIATFRCAAKFGRDWSNSEHWSGLALNGLVANDSLADIGIYSGALVLSFVSHDARHCLHTASDR